MDLVDCYNKYLLGKRFVHMVNPNVYDTFSKIENKKISIKWGDSYKQKFYYTIPEVFDLIECGNWILTKRTLRKIKLEKLLNGFSRKI